MDNLTITLFNGGVCERHFCSWDDVRAFMTILEPGEGYTAILIQDQMGKEVLGTMIQ